MKILKINQLGTHGAIIVGYKQRIHIIQKEIAELIKINPELKEEKLRIKN